MSSEHGRNARWRAGATSNRRAPGNGTGRVTCWKPDEKKFFKQTNNGTTDGKRVARKKFSKITGRRGQRSRRRKGDGWGAAAGANWHRTRVTTTPLSRDGDVWRTKARGDTRGTRRTGGRRTYATDWHAACVPRPRPKTVAVAHGKWPPVSTPHWSAARLRRGSRAAAAAASAAADRASSETDDGERSAADGPETRRPTVRRSTRVPRAFSG